MNPNDAMSCITIGGGGGPPLSKNKVLGFALILGSPLPLIYFDLDFEWTNPAVQNSKPWPWIRNKKYLFTFKDAQIISHSNYRTLSVVMTSFRKYCHNYFRAIEEGGWLSNYCKLWESSCFWILSVPILRTDLMIRCDQGSLNNRTIEILIGAVNQIHSLWFLLFFKLPWWAKSIFWPKLSPKAPNLPKIQILRTADHRKLVDHSKWPKKWIYTGFLRCVHPSDEQKCPENAILFLGHNI